MGFAEAEMLATEGQHTSEPLFLSLGHKFGYLLAVCTGYSPDERKVATRFVRKPPVNIRSI